MTIRNDCEQVVEDSLQEWVQNLVKDYKVEFPHISLLSTEPNLECLSLVCSINKASGSIISSDSSTKKRSKSMQSLILKSNEYHQSYVKVLTLFVIRQQLELLGQIGQTLELINSSVNDIASLLSPISEIMRKLKRHKNLETDIRSSVTSYFKSREYYMTQTHPITKLIKTKFQNLLSTFRTTVRDYAASIIIEDQEEFDLELLQRCLELEKNLIDDNDTIESSSAMIHIWDLESLIALAIVHNECVVKSTAALDNRFFITKDTWNNMLQQYSNELCNSACPASITTWTVSQVMMLNSSSDNRYGMFPTVDYSILKSWPSISPEKSTAHRSSSEFMSARLRDMAAIHPLNLTLLPSSNICSNYLKVWPTSLVASVASIYGKFYYTNKSSTTTVVPGSSSSPAIEFDILQSVMEKCDTELYFDASIYSIIPFVSHYATMPPCKKGLVILWDSIGRVQLLQAFVTRHLETIVSTEHANDIEGKFPSSMIFNDFHTLYMQLRIQLSYFSRDTVAQFKEHVASFFKANVDKSLYQNVVQVEAPRQYIIKAKETLLDHVVDSIGSQNEGYEDDRGFLHQLVDAFIEELTIAIGRHKKYCITLQGVRAIHVDFNSLKDWIENHGLLLDALPSIKRLSLIVKVMALPPPERKLSMLRSTTVSLPDAKRWISLCERVTDNKQSARVACADGETNTSSTDSLKV